MKISCEVALDYQGNPKIKITKDKPQITLDVLTNDVNYLMSLTEKELILIAKEDD